MTRPARLLPLTAAATAAVVLLATPATAAGAGAPGGGDPYFPWAGNGGYQVDDYDLSLRYTPSSRAMSGTAVLTARATADLSSFNLDLRDFRVRSVRVDGRAATFTKSQGELKVRPAAPLAAGRAFRVTVVYEGTTGRPTDASGALYGWVSTPDGALVANEPEGASTWYPVNDLPTDKATYTFRIDVPAGKTAVANGDLVSTVTRQGRTTFTWRAEDPMASYLSTASVGDYELRRSRTASGLPIIDAVDRDLTPEARRVTDASLSKQAAMIDFFERRFGPYPFSSFGAIVDDDSVGYALETQTRPIYSGVADESTVAHELAHQWYGNSVTLRTWDDIWLNEGFASYAEWLWSGETGGPNVSAQFAEAYAIPADDPFWTVTPHDPGVDDMFAGAVYVRGAMTLAALRDEIGGDAMARLLRAWERDHRDGNASTADLVRLASEIAGRDLAPFFRTWIDTPRKPTSW